MAVVPSTLPREYYRSAEIFAAEMERIFGTYWICLGRADQIAAPGEYRVEMVAGESLLIVRGRDETLRAFHNVCRHRGSPLCTEGSGRLSGAITCWAATCG